MKWIKAYYIGTDEIVQRPIDDAMAKELLVGGCFLTKDIQLGEFAWPGVPIMADVSSLRFELFDPRKPRT